MCVIIDANVCRLVFTDTPDPNFLPVIHWLNDPIKQGCMVVGGHLAEELARVSRAQPFLAELSRSGSLLHINDEDVNVEEKRIQKGRLCCSDDSHIIALARVSGARTLCTNDGNLCIDFRNHMLISEPRGRIYKRPDQANRLLVHTGSCQRPRRRRSKPQKHH